MGSRCPVGRGNFKGKGAARCKYSDSTVTCAKTAEPIEMSFGIWTRVGQRNHVLGGLQCNLANTKEPSMCGGDTACDQITLTTCLPLSHLYVFNDFCLDFSVFVVRYHTIAV